MQQEKPVVGIADLVTAIRIPLAIAFPLVTRVPWRIAILVIAALSDLVDGKIARRMGSSRIGVVPDPVADKLFMLSAFLSVWLPESGRELLTVWELLVVLSRDIVAFVGFLVSLVMKRATTLPARAGGKWVTVGQLLTLLAFLTAPSWVRPFAWATAAISIYAIVDYGRVARKGWM